MRLAAPARRQGGRGADHCGTVGAGDDGRLIVRMIIYNDDFPQTGIIEPV
jgi:hypothetical protein